MMKKVAKLLVLLLSVTALCFTATACGGSSDPQPTPTPSVSTSASVTPTPGTSTAPSVVPSVVPSVAPSISPTPSVDWDSVFTVNGTGETITGLTAYGKTLSKIEIPETLNGVQITAIGDSAFYDCDSLTTVTFGENSQLTSIGEDAFRNCSSLTEIVIPDSVTSIGYRAFYDCDSLTIYCEVASKPSGWNSSWTSSSCPVVWNCKNNDVADDGNIYTVQNDIRYALKDGIATVVEQPRNITGSITIPASVAYNGTTYSVTSIGEDAFRYCYSLTTVTFGENSQLTSIGSYAFYHCDSLTEIVIPGSVTSIGEYAFEYCDSLTKITFSDTSTWYRTTNNSNWYNKTGGTQTNVSTPTQNATYFKSTYNDYYWYKL
ncbi:MAG: leucine-rich repeat domain-containing protein [Clostridia bacterium]|nr:leucine-rich repeat domain-containing protein [Clostridia bacterium]